MELCSSLLSRGAAGAIARRVFLAAPLLLRAQSARPRPARLRVAISSTMLGEVNENDVKAAFRAWADELCRDGGIEVRSDATMLMESRDLAVAVGRGQLDVFGVTFPEYAQLPEAASDNAILDDVTLQTGHEYLVLAHRDHHSTSLAALKGHTALIYRNPRMSLVEEWLESVLGPEGAPSRYFASAVPQAKLSKVVLPVFFKQTDCCVLTAAAFATMCEMNPQLSRTLVVVARSPKLAPSLLAFHRNCPQPSRVSLAAALGRLRASTAGKQVLMLFQCGNPVLAPGSALRSSHELLSAVRARRGRRG